MSPDLRSTRRPTAWQALARHDKRLEQNALRRIRPWLCPRIENLESNLEMPSFDIVSEVDKQELDNAINQARKELATRFDFKGTAAEILAEKDKIILTAEDAARLRGLREIVISKLSKRGVDLRNIEQADPEISSVGHARQELRIQRGLEGNKAKEIIQAIKSQGFKVQSQLQDRQIRVTGKKKDDLQAVIQFVRSRDFGVATNFKNFRD
jgi:cyclic-di-GMP-binding protein